MIVEKFLPFMIFFSTIFCKMWYYDLNVSCGMFDEKILRILLILDINNNDNRNFIKENLKKIIVMNIFYYNLVVKIFVLVHFSSSQKKCKITMIIKKNCECVVCVLYGVYV